MLLQETILRVVVEAMLQLRVWRDSVVERRQVQCLHDCFSSAWIVDLGAVLQLASADLVQMELLSGRGVLQGGRVLLS